MYGGKYHKSDRKATEEIGNTTHTQTTLTFILYNDVQKTNHAESKKLQYIALYNSKQLTGDCFSSYEINTELHGNTL